jgi:hypothetical protein
MTTLIMATPVEAEGLDTPEAQDARWIAWKARSAAADRITQQRMRAAFVALFAAVCVTLAVLL